MNRKLLINIESKMGIMPHYHKHRQYKIYTRGNTRISLTEFVIDIQRTTYITHETINVCKNRKQIYIIKQINNYIVQYALLMEIWKIILVAAEIRRSISIVKKILKDLVFLI